MKMLAHVGAVTFRLAGTTAARLTAFEPQPMGSLNDSPLFRIADGDEVYLVMDHRRFATDGDARVEFWEAGGGEDASLSGLFALGDLHNPDGQTPEPMTLAAIARMLKARPG